MLVDFSHYSFTKQNSHFQAINNQTYHQTSQFSDNESAYDLSCKPKQLHQVVDQQTSSQVVDLTRKTEDIVSLFSSRQLANMRSEVATRLARDLVMKDDRNRDVESDAASSGFNEKVLKTCFRIKIKKWNSLISCHVCKFYFHNFIFS